MQAPQQRGTARIFISHGAGTGHGDPKGPCVDWFIVEPRDEPVMLAKQVESLRRAGRAVIELEVEPYSDFARQVL